LSGIEPGREAIMNTQIRDKVFETNSSSSHSVTIAGEELADFGLSKEELREGVIRIEGGFHFGEARELYSDTKTKIAYLLIQAMDGDIYGEQGVDNIPSMKLESKKAKGLIDLVESVTGCRLEFYATYGSIDSESYHVGQELFEDDAMLRQFLFSRESTLKTQSNNDAFWENNPHLAR
jgi:hypothetical protein